MSLMMKTAIEALKSQVFKIILAKMSSADLHQRASAPVLLAKLEEYAEPYVKALPKAVNFAIAKVTFALIAVGSFFAFFTEALRQRDLTGEFVPSAFFIGYLTVFLVATAVYYALRAPKIEKLARASLVPEIDEVRPRESVFEAPSAGAAMDSGTLPLDYSNVEQLKRPAQMSATEYLLNELRAERASFRRRN